MKRHPLHAGIGDAGLALSMRAVIEMPAFSSAPVRLDIDDEAVPISTEWPWDMLGARLHAFAAWTADWESWGSSWSIGVRTRSQRLILAAPGMFTSADEAVALLESLPFSVCSLGSVHPDTWGPDYKRHGFSQAHFAHGWGCAFRGAGHDLLVSRRWLEFGPWHIIRRPGDLTVVQFHDLDADPETALAQALPGHARMGISDEGGFLQMPYPFAKNVEGLYDAATRRLEIVVPPGDVVAQVLMQDACAIRYMHRVEPPAQPIEHIAYVFVDESDAQAHLHELWLRELECWLVDEQGRRRLDLDYRPVACPPDWVRSLERRR